MTRSPSSAPDPVSPQDIERAAVAGADIVRHTPLLSSRTLSQRLGATIVLKAENLQRTGSFKLRGAVAKLAALGDRCAPGVVTASAGNHGQALAYAAKARGVPCAVFMPEQAPVAKVEAARELGASVHLVSSEVDESLAAARDHAAAAGVEFVHPFDDPAVIAGQGTLGLELLADLPDLATVIVPVGGGGLASGVAIALKDLRPGIRVVGVQVEGYAAIAQSLAAGHAVVAAGAPTIADGIAVKQPGELTLKLIEKWVDEVVVVGEDEVAEAMVFLLERTKLAVEGAGAVGVAALSSGQVKLRGPVVVVLSGGNVDPGLLGEIVRRHESQAGRRVVLAVRMPDQPGALAGLLGVVAAQGANLLDVVHLREGLDLHVRETAVQLVLQTRGPGHAEQVVRAIRHAGYSEPPPSR
ncbi:MAG TPA: threonine ammonia-lyase [Solirubrobacteraceae bacterium]|nr:threonine ammonia-lyase [Solirubrobacteraceae bacterium]